MQGKHAAALELYSKVLTIKEKVLGRNHPVVANTYNKCAHLPLLSRRQSC